MTAIWPSEVPLFALQSGYGEEPERNVATFQPEVGPPKERRRTSIDTETLSFATWMESAQWDSLLRFYRVDLMSGVLPFVRTHPRSGTPLTFKFIAAPKITATVGPSTFQIALVLRRMP